MTTTGSRDADELQSGCAAVSPPGAARFGSVARAGSSRSSVRLPCPPGSRPKPVPTHFAKHGDLFSKGFRV